MCGKSGCGVLVVLFLLTAAAEAGDLQLRLGGGYLDLVRAHNSVRAVFDSTGGATAKLGLRWPFSGSAYVGIDGQYFRKTGHQAFGCGRTACGPGLEGLSLRLIPVHASIGVQATGHAFRPYIGLGFGFLSYHEEDPSFSNPTTDISPAPGVWRPGCGRWGDVGSHL